MKNHLQRLFQHMSWADERVLDRLAAVDPAQTEDAVRLFAHVLGSERVWLLRLQSRDSSDHPVWPAWSLEEMRGAAADNRGEYRFLLEEVTEEGLERLVEYRNSKGITFQNRAVDILTHVAMHGSYHRGQVARALRLAGAEPVNTDYITWVREGAPEAP